MTTTHLEQPGGSVTSSFLALKKPPEAKGAALERASLFTFDVRTPHMFRNPFAELQSTCGSYSKPFPRTRTEGFASFRRVGGSLQTWTSNLQRLKRFQSRTKRWASRTPRASRCVVESCLKYFGVCRTWFLLEVFHLLKPS